MLKNEQIALDKLAEDGATNNINLREHFAVKHCNTNEG